MLKFIKAGVRGYKGKHPLKNQVIFAHKKATVFVRIVKKVARPYYAKVPQFGVLFSTLFKLFINDVVKKLPKGVRVNGVKAVRAALHADNVVLWITETYASTAAHRM